MNSKEFYCGRRLSFEGNLCTVRYVGPVEGTKGTWLGVEWDDPARGKHSGEHNGKEYFKCNSKEPTAASFVRTTRPHDRPYSFIEALQKRFVSQDEQTDVENIEAVINISGKDVEEVGFDKINEYFANTRDLPIVLLDGACIGIRRGGSKSTDYSFTKGIAEACPKAVDLDLSRNLFERWEEVVSIIEQLPLVSRLRVDGNILSDFDVTERSATNFESPPFVTLKELSFKDGYLDWQHVSCMTRIFPSLETLEIGGNGLRELSNMHLPATLTSISLERNMFESLDELKPLTQLHSLETLDLNNNKIKSVSRTAVNDSDIPKDFVFAPTLRNLDLSEDQISSWRFISILPTIFPGMRSLRVSSNPLYLTMADANDPKITSDEGFILTVARIGQLEILNRSQLTSKQRLDAETFYLSQIGKELSSRPEADTDSILAQHPRYPELCKVYGEPIVLRQQGTTVASNTLASRLVKLTFRLDESTMKGAETAAQSWTTEIPLSFTVYNVLGMVAGYFGLCAMHLRLIWETDEEMPEQITGLLAENARGSDAESVQQKYREERLEPKLRSIGTWIESLEARIRVELDHEEIKRHDAVRKAMAERIQGVEESSSGFGAVTV